jgi:hypothetical protein
MMTLVVVYLVMQTGEISAIVTKSTIWTYGFRERWTKFGIAIKTIHIFLPEDICR